MNPLDLFPKAKQPTAEGDSTTTPGTAGDGTTTDAEPSADRNPNRSSTTRDGQCVNCRRQAPDHTAPAPRNRHRAKGNPVSNRDPKLTVAEVCDELNVAKSTFYDWRTKGRAPRCIRLPNGDLRIRRSELDRWIEAREDAA